MPHIGASVRIQGLKEEAEGLALVDTGSSFTVIDESLANAIGVELIDAEKVHVRGNCCTVEGELASIRRILVEGKMLGSTTAIVAGLSSEVRETLKKLGFRDDIIIGVRELAGFTLDVKEGKLKYVGALLI